MKLALDAVFWLSRNIEGLPSLLNEIVRIQLISIVFLQREYEEFKVRVNALVAKAQKVPDEGWTMQDGTPWPGNNTRDHPGMIQVSFLV